MEKSIRILIGWPQMPIPIRQIDARSDRIHNNVPSIKILILPKGHGVRVAELPLEPDEKPAEAEEQVSRFLHVCAPPHNKKLFAQFFFD
jgi:hypothetical protein